MKPRTPTEINSHSNPLWWGLEKNGHDGKGRGGGGYENKREKMMRSNEMIRSVWQSSVVETIRRGRERGRKGGEGKLNEDLRSRIQMQQQVDQSHSQFTTFFYTVVIYYTILYYTLLCYAVMYFTIIYYGMICFSTLCFTVLRYPIF